MTRDAWRVAHAHLRGIAYKRVWHRVSAVDWALVTRLVMRVTGDHSVRAWQRVRAWRDAFEPPRGQLGTLLGMQFIDEGYASGTNADSW